MAGVTEVSERRTTEAEPRGHFHQVGERIGLHLLHHLAAVGFHRDFADAELATDLLVQPAGDHQVHDLPFATGEGRVTVSYCASNRSRICSARKCYLCPRNKLSPMCPERTCHDKSGREDLNLRPPGPEAVTKGNDV